MIIESKEYDLFIGSKIGSFKHIKYHTDSTRNTKKCIENLVEIKTLVKDDTITCMSWGNAEQTEILLGRKNGQVQIYDTQLGEFTKSVVAEYGSGDIVGVAKYKRRVISARRDGSVAVWGKKGDSVTHSGGELDVLKGCADDTAVYATGGQENDLKVWRIGEDKPTFEAKNLANDWLQLRRPVWVSDLCFLPGEGGRILAVASRHGYVRLYDARAQRRPVCNVDFKAMAATCIVPSFDERQVLVGFGRGQMHQVDLRIGRPDKGFKGATGAITSIGIIPDTKQIASASLDRHCRVHDYTTKELKYKQYLTSKLSTILVQSVTSTPLRSPPEEVKDEVEVKEEDELGELFDAMDEISEKPKKKKHTEESIPNAKRMRPSAEGRSEVVDDQEEEELNEEDEEERIKKLLKSTEKKKRKMEKKKREKKAKSLFHNA